MVKFTLQPQVRKKLHLHRKRIDEINLVPRVRGDELQKMTALKSRLVAEFPRDIARDSVRLDMPRGVFFLKDVVFGEFTIFIGRVVVGRECPVEQGELRGEVVDLVEVGGYFQRVIYPRSCFGAKLFDFFKNANDFIAIVHQDECFKSTFEELLCIQQKICISVKIPDMIVNTVFALL